MLPKLPPATLEYSLPSLTPHKLLNITLLPSPTLPDRFLPRSLISRGWGLGRVGEGGGGNCPIQGYLSSAKLATWN